MSIIIVDDSADNRTLLRAILINAGYTEVLTAASAHDAFDHLVKQFLLYVQPRPGATALTVVEEDGTRRTRYGKVYVGIL